MKLTNYRLAVLLKILMVTTPPCGGFIVFYAVANYQEISTGDYLFQEIFWGSFVLIVLSIAALLLIHRYLKAYSVVLEPGVPRFSKRIYGQANIVILGGQRWSQIVLPKGWKLEEVPRYARHVNVLDENGKLRLIVEFEAYRYLIVVVPRFEIHWVKDNVGVTAFIYDNAAPGPPIYRTRTYKFGEAFTEDDLYRDSHQEALGWLAAHGIKLGQHRRNWARTFSFR